MNLVVAESFASRLFTYYINGLGTAAGLTGILAGLCLAVVAVMVDRSKWWLISLSILFGTIAFRGSPSIKEVGPPFSFIAVASQGILLGVLLVLAVPAVRPVARVRAWAPRGVMFSLLAFQLIYHLRLTTGGEAEKAALAAPSCLLMAMVLGVGLSRWLAELEDVRRLMRAVAWGVILIMATSAYYLVVDRSGAMAGGRLYGVSANPQRLAVTLSLAVPYAFALLQDRGGTARSRAFYGVVAAAALITVVGTGSRTGGLMCLVGTAFYFRRRLGSVALLGAFVAAVGLAVWLTVGADIRAGGERILSTQDTRAQVWTDLLGTFASSPLVGSPSEYARENSYLSVAANAGLLGAVPLALFVGAMCRSAYRVARRRQQLGPYAPVVDLVVASVAQLLVAWMFEGALLGSLTEHIFALYCTIALLGVATEQAALVAAGGHPGGRLPYDDAGGLDPSYGAAA